MALERKETPVRGKGREARLWDRAEKGYANCRLCEFRCRVARGARGVCGVRQNTGGTLYTLVYDKVIAEHIDPVEKKPLFHFHPGSTTYSIATPGCNFRCLNCQNSDISQTPRDEGIIAGDGTTPAEIVSEALETGCSSVSYTYTEPTIFFELAYDTAVEARAMGLDNIFVTNGYMTLDCLEEMSGLLSAANVDIKSFSDDFYKKICGARLAPVLRNIEHMLKTGVWVEATTLVIPGLNDSLDEMRRIAKWISKTDRRMPWHVSAFHPTYKLMDLPCTPAELLGRIREIGFEEGLRYVYTGNIPGCGGESTYCYNCGRILIERTGFRVKKNSVVEGKCPGCSSIIDGAGL